MTSVAAELPIMAVLPQLLGALSIRPNAVLIAPPGAGKTTRVAPALLDQPWAAGAIWLLSPRRLAARAAAERIAEELGEAVGGRVGYATRLDSKVGADTRLLVMTHGLFRNRLLADPELTGVSAVLFDEIHERSLDSDFALALAIDAQQGLRPDLRLLAMSATLDGTRFAGLLGGASVIESKGQSFPLKLRYLGRRVEQPLPEAMVGAVRQVLANGEPGDILAFLPGAADIERTAERVDAAGLRLVVHRLHGQIDPAIQRAALAPDGAGRRKLILASSIAETSLTIDGVRIVVDSGLARRPRLDRDAGMTRLVTERASQAAATQRAGRAARQAMGIAYRLWEEAATAGMPPFDPPEIHESDLMPVVLDCASWGIVDPRQLAWLDQPSPAAVDDARSRLEAIGALGPDGRITKHGKGLAAIPLPVPLAHMLAISKDERAAELAVMLTEPGLGGRNVDLEQRWNSWKSTRGERAEGARRLAKRIAKHSRSGNAPSQNACDWSVGALLALAWPDRVSQRRGGSRGDYLSVGGRAFRLDPTDPLAGQEWLVVADAQGRADGARILAAAAIEAAEVEAIFANRVAEQTICRFDAAADRVDIVSERRLGAIRLATRRAERNAAVLAEDVAARLDFVRAQGLTVIGWGESALALCQRGHFAGIQTLSDAALLDGLDDWLAPVLVRTRGLRDLPDSVLADALLGRLDWSERQALDRIAPSHFISPTGARHAIDYGAEGGPMVTLRVQELFGLATHPTVGQPPVPLVLALTSPAHRPIQLTRDLPGFWLGSWRDVQREMKGRYPKHSWPDDPANARASTMTKAAQARRDGAT
ncbi:MAG: ATP-dependent helicase HrpB [Sphingopyxis sp.]|nr:ATP-dependent helicase HrpB [Sphingopyxis sp.]